ncbi:hypothetical protein A2U01_0078016, partial [Trifolium medium]|nr:hypothetical protein [Trifolium medium]
VNIRYPWISAGTVGICEDGDVDKYSPVGTGIEAKTPPQALRGGERGSFLRTFPTPLTSLGILPVEL